MTANGTAPSPLVGAHVDSVDPLAAAAQTGADVAQFFLADPQGWKAPKEHEHAGEIRASELTIYIHSPYVLNVATTNNRIRIPSRKLLGQHAVAAADIGAKGLIVHGGHLNATDDPAIGVDNWRKTFARQADEGGFPLPILIENTAGGGNAVARRFDRLAMLWDAVGEFGAGFCLDTCHAYAGGEDLVGIVERVLSITGRIDLVHANRRMAESRFRIPVRVLPFVYSRHRLGLAFNRLVKLSPRCAGWPVATCSSRRRVVLMARAPTSTTCANTSSSDVTDVIGVTGVISVIDFD